MGFDQGWDCKSEGISSVKTVPNFGTVAARFFATLRVFGAYHWMVRPWYGFAKSATFARCCGPYRLVGYRYEHFPWCS
jgi:hypothetical protein